MSGSQNTNSKGNSVPLKVGSYLTCVLVVGLVVWGPWIWQSAMTSQLPWLDFIRSFREWLQGSPDQPLLVLPLVAHVILQIWLPWIRDRRRPDLPPVLATLLIVLTTGAYLHSPVNPATRSTYILFCCFWFLGAWISRQKHLHVKLRQFLTLGLTIAVLWPIEGQDTFTYRESIRWTGPWKNPNPFGLMMGVGLFLGCQQWALARSRNRADWMGFWGAITVLIGWGLLSSYSRGAWLGVALGLLFLAFQRIPDPLRKRRLGFWFLLLILGSGSIATHLAASVESPLPRRVLSAFNPNDFSSRNRLTAQFDAIAMMGESPGLGLGWGSGWTFYNALFAPDKMKDTGAVILNNFLLLGVEAGLPAWILWIAWLACGWQSGIHPPGKKKPSYLELAALLPLGCGMVLDGALMHWSTGGTFFLLTAMTWPAWHPSSHASPSQPFRPATWKPVVLLLLVLMGILACNTLRIPFTARLHRVAIPSGEGFSLCELTPKTSEIRGEVLYWHGRGDSLWRNGRRLRSLIRQGFKVYCFEDLHLHENLHPEVTATVVRWWRNQVSKGSAPTLWWTVSRGTQRSLDWLLDHPEDMPDGIVGLAPGWPTRWGLPPSIQGRSKPKPNEFIPGAFQDCHVLLVQGGRDEVSRLSDSMCLAHRLLQAGAIVDFFEIPEADHIFNGHITQMLHGAGEWWNEPSSSLALTSKGTKGTLRGLAWIGILLMLGLIFQRVKARAGSLVPTNFQEKTLATAAFLTCLLGLGWTAFEYGLPADHPWAASLVQGTAARRAWNHVVVHEAGQDRARDWTDAAELPEYRGPFLYNAREEPWWNHVVSSSISPSLAPSHRWRRPLWEWFYPRVRQARSAEEAAEWVIQELRERMSISRDEARKPDILEWWISGKIHPDDWPVLCVAALRAATVAARLNPQGQAEYHDGAHWRPVPMALWETRRVHLLGASSDDGMNDPSCHPGEARIQPLEPEGQASVLNSHKMEHGGMQVMNMHGILHSVVSKLISRPIADPRLDTSAGQEHGEPLDMVIPSTSLRHRSPTKFATPQDQGIIQHASLLQVGNQGSGGSIHFFGRGFHALLDAAMMIPGPMIELDEADTSLRQTTSHQAVGCE